MSNESVDAGVKLDGCGHVFCKECIAQYITVKVKEAQVLDIKCPFIDDNQMQVHSLYTPWCAVMWCVARV